MARCDEGYRCTVCQSDVEAIVDSDLYLQYVLGEIPLESLHLRPECHIRCNAALAQYIVDAAFEPVYCEGPFDKRTLDAEFVANEERRMTHGWRRLQSLPASRLAVPEYPLHITPWEG
jgi:hypothetical protein